MESGHSNDDIKELTNNFTHLTTSNKSATLDNIAKILENPDSKVITFTGAGISTAAGIPDFRSPNGLYNLIKSEMNIPRPEMVFNLDYFKSNPNVFFTVAKKFIEIQYEPTWTHCFIGLLHEKHILLRNFTQNIDGLDDRVGLPQEVNVECHGHFRTGHCLQCKHECSFEDMKTQLSTTGSIYCGQENCKGLVKPDIVLFGEALPEKVFHNIDKITHADLVIIMGTSLRVAPFNMFINLAASGTPVLVINNENPFGDESELSRDDLVYLESSCDDGVRQICQKLGWVSEVDRIFDKFHCKI